MSQPGYSPNNDYLVIPIDLNEAFKKEAYTVTAINDAHVSGVKVIQQIKLVNIVLVEVPSREAIFELQSKLGPRFSIEPNIYGYLL
jgi:hypothetical protein